MKETDQDPATDSPAAAAAASDAAPRATPSAIALGGAIAAVVALLVLTWRVAFLVDDAYITFRFARNWSDWGTPVFNAFELAPEGQPVEGFSNFLWTALLAALHGVGADLPTVAVALQALLGAATVALVARFAHAELRLGPVGAVGAALLLATSAPFVAWTSGGMETSLFTLLLTAFVIGALRPADRGGVLLGLLGAGVALVRVEGILWVLGALVAVGAGEWLRSGEGLAGLARSRRRIAIAAAIAFVALAVQIAWRQSVYGSMLPNTVAAKTGGGVDVAARGARQVASWAIVTIAPIAALVAFVPAVLRHANERARVAAVAASVVVLGAVAYNVAVGGDWMPFFRFLAPIAPALALLLAIGLDAIPRTAGAVAAAVLVVLQPLALFDVHLAPESAREALRFRTFQGGYRTEAARVGAARVNEEYFSRLGHALAVGTEKGDVLSFGAIGSPGWFAPDLDFVDRNGLVTPEVARREVTPGGGTAGHEKRVPHAWFLDSGTPSPNLLFATWRDGLFDATDAQALRAAKHTVRTTGMTAKPEERPLFGRTVLRLTPIAEGPAAGCTLLLLERTEPDVARAFWGL